MTSPRAMETRICMPPDSSRGRWPANLSSPTMRQRVGARAASASAAGTPREVERQAHVGLHARPGHQRRRPGTRTTSGGRRALDLHRQACATTAAGRRSARSSSGDHLQQRALAAARRAEQRDELAVADRQVDGLQRLGAVGEDLVRGPDLDDGFPRPGGSSDDGGHCDGWSRRLTARARLRAR